MSDTTRVLFVTSEQARGLARNLPWWLGFMRDHELRLKRGGSCFEVVTRDDLKATMKLLQNLGYAEIYESDYYQALVVVCKGDTLDKHGLTLAQSTVLPVRSSRWVTEVSIRYANPLAD